jgi:hypothetical protein
VTLAEAKELFRTKGGSIRAFAVTRESLANIAHDMVLEGLSLGDRILGFPVVIVQDGQPEGVIV